MTCPKDLFKIIENTNELMNGVVNEINSSDFEDAMDGDCYGRWNGNNYSCDLYVCSSLWTTELSCRYPGTFFRNELIGSQFVWISSGSKSCRYGHRM